MGTTVRTALRALREAVRRHEASGGDWRDVMAAMRPHVPWFWQRLPLAERRRFLQRLRPYWDAARHRCAPDSHARFEALRAAGQVQPIAALLLAMGEVPGGVEVEFLRRGAASSQRLIVGRVVNCTGPSSSLRRIGNPLVSRLIDRGWLVPDALCMGVMVDEHGALLDRQGQPSARLHYIGPLLRARDWEATAVPELRGHAYRLATTLLASCVQATA